MFSLVVSALLATLIATFYLYANRMYSYWKRKNVPYAEPSIPFGNFGPLFMRKSTMGKKLQELYESTNDPMLGIYVAFRPILLVRDPKLINDILVKGFEHFWHRGFHFDSDHDSLALNLFSKSGKKWREMRNMMSPAFTSGKLKGMIETIVDCGQPFEDCIMKYADSGKEVEVREIFVNFTTNVIASIGFGIDVNCFNDPDNDFKTYSRRVFDPFHRNTIRLYMSFVSPFLTKLFRVRFCDEIVKDFMTETVRQNLEYREANNIIRKDFFQLLIQLRNEGKLEDDANHNWNTKIGKNKSLSLDELTAQAFIFITAGYESSSTTMTFCMYELAKNLNIQQQVYEEIRDVLQKYDGKITYDAIAEMKYLDCCIDETLRIHPPFDMVFRECVKDYQIADSDVVIEKGTPVLISITGLSFDPKYYDEPEKFMPERFMNDKGFSSRNTLARPYLVFGAGPRACIAARLGKINTKIGLCILLRKFSFELGEQHKNQELVIDPEHIARTPLNGVRLKFKAR